MVMSQMYSNMKANSSQVPSPASLKSFQAVENAIPVSPPAYISNFLAIGHRIHTTNKNFLAIAATITWLAVVHDSLCCQCREMHVL